MGPFLVNGTILTAGKDSGGLKTVPGLDWHSLMRLQVNSGEATAINASDGQGAISLPKERSGLKTRANCPSCNLLNIRVLVAVGFNWSRHEQVWPDRYHKREKTSSMMCHNLSVIL